MTNFNGVPFANLPRWRKTLGWWSSGTHQVHPPLLPSTVHYSLQIGPSFTLVVNFNPLSHRVLSHSRRTNRAVKWGRHWSSLLTLFLTGRKFQKDHQMVVTFNPLSHRILSQGGRANRTAKWGRHWSSLLTLSLTGSYLTAEGPIGPPNEDDIGRHL